MKLNPEIEEITVKKMKEILKDAPDNAFFYMWGVIDDTRTMYVINDLNLNPDKTAYGIELKPVISTKI